MLPRSEQSGQACRDQSDTVMLPARGAARDERVREIRRRIADDAYRSPEVAEVIARRILLSREL
ncbi:MAG TPA: hypothetical protein VF461_06585 [Gemmatimonadaceae bacterium]